MFRVLTVLAALFVAVPVSAQALFVHSPKPSATVAQTFTMTGESAGIDVVHVWGHPPSQSPVFLGAVYPVCPPPGAGSFCSFSMLTSLGALPTGTYQVAAYGHDPATNTFPVSQAVTVTVQMGPNIASGFNMNAYVNPVDLDDAFTVFPGGSAGGSIIFGVPSPSPRTCIAQGGTVSTTKTHATVAIPGPSSLAPIQVLCGGGR